MKKSSKILTVFNRFSPVSLLVAAALFTGLFLPGTSVLADGVANGSHTLTATISGQGTICPAGALSVTEGASKSFVFDSDANHRMVDVIVDGISIGPVAAFSFENISASHTIEAVFESAATLTADSRIGK